MHVTLPFLEPEPIIISYLEYSHGHLIGLLAPTLPPLFSFLPGSLSKVSF